MALSYDSEPVYPLPNKTCRLTFSGSGNYVKLLCADAPTGSKLKNKLNADGASRVRVLEGDTGKQLEFTPDVGGSYVFIGQDIQRGATNYGGGWLGAPDSSDSEALLSETTLTLRVGSRMTMPVGVQPDTAELVLYVWDTTVRATTEKVHGEISPKVSNGKTDKGKSAALLLGVQLIAAGLDGLTADTIVGDLSAQVTNLIDKYNSHHSAGAYHNAVDADNSLDNSFRLPASPEAVKRSVREIWSKLDRHMLNDNGNGAGSAAYHQPFLKAADWLNKLLPQNTGDLQNSLITFADCWRAFYGHLSSSVHTIPDVANFPASLSALLELQRQFLLGTSQLNPGSPSTSNAGVVTFVSRAGMREG